MSHPHQFVGHRHHHHHHSPILLIASYQTETYIDGSEVAVCLTSVDTFWPAFYFVVSISIFFLLPFLMLLVLYSIIAQHLMNNPGVISHGHHHHQHGPHRSNVIKYRKQVIFMLAAVVLSFFICLLPFRAFTMWIIIVPSETIMALGVEGYYNILYFCRIMLYLNSAMNPILYNLMSTKFRHGFLRLLGCMSRTGGKHAIVGRQGTLTNSTNLSSSSSSSRRDNFRKGSSRSMAGSFSVEERDNLAASSSDEEQPVVVKLKLQTNFDDIQEIEESDDHHSAAMAMKPLKAVTFDMQTISQACISPFYIHRTLAEHYLQNNGNREATRACDGIRYPPPLPCPSSPRCTRDDEITAESKENVDFKMPQLTTASHSPLHIRAASKESIV